MSNCPLWAFVKDHGYEEMMPYICKSDYVFEKFLHAKLIRTRTEATGGDYCDYCFVPDQSKVAKRFEAKKKKNNTALQESSKSRALDY